MPLLFENAQPSKEPRSTVSSFPKQLFTVSMPQETKEKDGQRPRFVTVALNIAAHAHCFQSIKVLVSNHFPAHTTQSSTRVK